MTGQLNTNLLNSNSEEIQEELDTLSNRLDGVESVTSANTDKINEVDNKVDNLANCVSTDSLKATNVATCNIQGSSATITGINTDNVTVSNKIKATNIEADNITGTINGNVSANTIDVATANIATANVTEKIMAASAEITSINATNANVTQSLTTDTLTTNCICNTGDATIAGCLNVKGICLTNGTNLYGNAVDVCNVWARHNICGLCHATIDGNLTVKGTITGKNINGNITSTNANITNGTIDNLTVNCALTIADGITLPNTLGDTTLTKVTTDCLLVNGDTELNGAVKAGSITIGDGSITAGEVCIGAKGIVIDKDKNADFNNISVNNMNANSIGVPGKIAADCIELLDSVVSKNVFAKNLYPENITIDKNVGDLHYSRQLDTDAVGGVLVDCKTITPKEGATGIITKYKDTEANTINPDSIEYVNEKNGIKVVSCSTTDKTTNEITFDTGTNVYSIKTDETGFGIYAGDEKTFGIGTNGKANICICKCTGADTLVGNVVKLDENGGLYTGRADGLSDGAIVDGVCSNTLKNTAINIDSNISREAVGYNCYYNCYTRSLGATENKIYDYCADTHSSCGECSYDIIATTDKVTAMFCNCCKMTGGTTISKETYELYPRMVCHNISVDGKTDNLLICHSPRSASFLGRYSKLHDEYSWEAKICDSNICITNPSRTTTGEPEVIFKVEDGKIYTKCGEFNAGGGFFVDDTFSNNCIRGTRSVVNDTITTCVIKSVSSNVDCYSFETSTPNSICFGFGTNDCLTDSSPIPENNYKKNYFIYTQNPNNSCCCGPLICTEWSRQSATCYPLYKSNSCYNIVTNEYCYNCQQISPTSGNVISSCDIYKSDKCNTCNIISSETTSDHNCCRCFCFYETPITSCCCGTYYWCQSDYCTCCYCDTICNNYGNCLQCDITCRCTYTCFTNSSCNLTCYCHYNMECYSSVCPAFVCSICNQYDEPVEGNETEICLGNYCSCGCNFVYKYSCSCGTICGCSYEYDSGSYETCYAYYPRYSCTSQYTRYFNGDYLCGRKYNATTCHYDFFCTCSCVNISDSSIYKYLCINNSYISLKEKVTTNQIANLPITNTLVPLAGKVNGNGFAFFCKGADGIKFYDGAFATVDAGTATDVTYLVTTGV